MNRPNLYLLSYKPELNYGHVTAVVGLNLIFDSEIRLRDSGNDMVVLESIALNRERLKASYGDIEGLTLGRGFIVNNYYSNTSDNVSTNKQKGFILDTIGPKSHVTFFGTVRKFAGVRAERNLGRVNLGTTVVLDPRQNPDLEVYALDGKFKIVPDKWSASLEFANIVHAGAGFVIGSTLTPLPKTNIVIETEYRKFDSDFAPGLVDEHYEAKPALDAIRANPPGRVDGLYFAANFFPGARNTLRFVHEDYEGSRPRTGLEFSFQPIERLGLKLFYSQENLVPSGNIRPQDAVTLATLTLGLTKRLDLKFNYYHAFDEQGVPLKSTTVKLRIHKEK